MAENGPQVAKSPFHSVHVNLHLDLDFGACWFSQEYVLAVCVFFCSRFRRRLGVRGDECGARIERDLDLGREI